MGTTTTAAMLFCCVALSVVAVGFAVPEKSSKFISMECPVRFDNAPGLDTVARACKGVPSAQRCCGAFKTFACPYKDLINDNAQNGCANDMFFQILVRGRLHPGLFSQLCVEGSQGLMC